MSVQLPHLIIMSGPESGRELHIPAEGARVGRATENDISIADASMSRFQCRFYFRDGRLWVMDLGSTNTTLLNDMEVSDSVLSHGDQLLIGESTIKVVRESGDDGSATAAVPESAGVFNLGGAAPAPAAEINLPPPVAEPPAAAAPISPDPTPVAAPAAASGDTPDTVDLGLGKKDDGDADEGGEGTPRQNMVMLLLVGLVTVLIVIGGGVAFMMMQNSSTPKDVVQQDPTFRILYEKTVGRPGNLYKYKFRVDRTGKASISIVDLAEGTNLEDEKTIEPRMYQEYRVGLMNRFENFKRLPDENMGTGGGNELEVMDLTVIMGTEVKRVRVENAIPSTAFSEIQQAIENYVDTEFRRVGALRLSRSQRLERAAYSWDQAQRAYAARSAKHGNHFYAKEQAKNAVYFLEDLSSQPDYFADAKLAANVWEEELIDELKTLWTNAKIDEGRLDYRAAMMKYGLIIAKWPDKDDGQYYKPAYEAYGRLERHLNR